MKILQVSLKPPYPKADGGCVAIASMTESLLHAEHEVKLLTMSTHKHPFVPQKVPSEISAPTNMEAVEIDTRIKLIDAFLNLFSSRSYNVQRFYSSAFEQRLIELLTAEDFDIIHLESIFCTPYLDTIGKNSNAKVVIRTHNVEFRIWEQLAAQEKNPIKKWYLSLLALRLKRYEIEALSKADGIVAITNDDARFLQQLETGVPVEVIPIGMDVSQIAEKPLPTDGLHLYHLGAMDWLPNQEAVQWFMDEVWPLIHQQLPQANCHLAGRNMPESFIAQATENLTISGEVNSMETFLSDKNIAVVPLISGSGLRVKIVEAMAYGKVVLTTTLGASGIPYSNGQNILIADTPSEFLEQLELLKSDPNRIIEIGKAARKLAETEFDIKQLSSKLTYFYANL